MISSSFPSAAPVPLPQLLLLKQTDQGQEKFTRDGIVQTARVVIKNTPFVLQLGLSSDSYFGHPLNFNQLTVEVKLLYDTEGSIEKMVDFVKVKPLEVKTHVSDRADQCTVEARIKVLSSQHEDLFFRLKVYALDARTGQEFSPSLCVLSHPIKVISKPEKVVKNNSLKKRNFTDMLMETVQRLEKQQTEQQSQISKLFDLHKQSLLSPPLTHFLAPPASSSSSSLQHSSETGRESKRPALEHSRQSEGHSISSSSASSSSSSSLVPSPAAPHGQTGQQAKKVEDPTDFEQTFRLLLDLYRSMPTEERIAKIRKIVRSLSSTETDTLTQLLDLSVAEGGLQHKQGGSSGEGEDHLEVCTCKGCHFKEELERLDEFYFDFLGPT